MVAKEFFLSMLRMLGINVCFKLLNTMALKWAILALMTPLFSFMFSFDMSIQLIFGYCRIPTHFTNQTRGFTLVMLGEHVFPVTGFIVVLLTANITNMPFIPVMQPPFVIIEGGFKNVCGITLVAKVLFLTRLWMSVIQMSLQGLPLFWFMITVCASVQYAIHMFVRNM